MVGLAGALYHKSFESGSFKPAGTPGWTHLGGVYRGAPAVIAKAVSNLNVYALGFEGAVTEGKWGDQPSAQGFSRLVSIKLFEDCSR